MLPSLLTSRLKSILSSDYDSALQAFSQERRGSLRLNLLKTNGEDVMKEFTEKGIITEEFPGMPGVYIFDRIHEYAIKGTHAFYDGKIYLQGIASMLPVLVLDIQKGEHVLDICAAPGSKTTQMAMIMNNEGSITALEQNQIRYDKLMYNCKTQGVTIVTGEKIDAKKYLTDTSGEYDKILLDAPCSAEGRILISNEKSYGFWSLENTKKKAELQYELFSNAIKLLKSGGIFVYSTCTLAPEENEGVVARILEENKDLDLQDIDIGLSEKVWWKPGMTNFGAKFYPDKLKKTVRILPSDETEGFFMAKVQKR